MNTDTVARDAAAKHIAQDDAQIRLTLSPALARSTAQAIDKLVQSGTLKDPLCSQLAMLGWQLNDSLSLSFSYALAYVLVVAIQDAVKDAADPVLADFGYQLEERIARRHPLIAKDLNTGWSYDLETALS